MKKTFKTSPKEIKAAIELDERFSFEFEDEFPGEKWDFEVYSSGDYVKCYILEEQVVDEHEVEYTILMEYPNYENAWRVLRDIEEYMYDLTDGSDYGFFAEVEKGIPEDFYGLNYDLGYDIDETDVWLYTATVNVYDVEREW